MGFHSGILVVNQSINRSYLDGSVVAADIVDAEEDALAVLLLVSGSEIALEKERKLISFFGRIQTYFAPIFIS